eukprot:2838384-Prymnesium_polylepis.1
MDNPRRLQRHPIAATPYARGVTCAPSVIAPHGLAEATATVTLAARSFAVRGARGIGRLRSACSPAVGGFRRARTLTP